MLLVHTLFLLEEAMTKAKALWSAVKEYGEVAAKGGVVPHSRRKVVEFIAQKWGISPDELERAIGRVGVTTRGKVDDFHELVFSAWGMVKSRLPKPVVDASNHVRLEVREKGPADDPMAQAETQPDYPKLPNVIRIFKPGAMDECGNNVVCYMALLAHEMWHIFSDRNKLYWKLLRISEGSLKNWEGIGKAETDRLLGMLDFFETTGLKDGFIENLKKKVLRYWGVKYTLEYAEIDRLNGILKKVKNPHVRGMFDDAMAEAMAGIATGRSAKVPYRFIQFVLEVGGLPGVVGLSEKAVV